jgi:hypothetical protein
MADDQTTDRSSNAPSSPEDEALAELRRAGEEAGVGTAMKVLENTELHYYGAVAKSTPRPHVVTRANTAPPT